LRRPRRIKIEFDPEKNAINIQKHGIPLIRFFRLDLAAAIVWPDNRKDYGEVRWLAAAPLNGRIHIACFCVRGAVYRVISLRKANKDERDPYAEKTHAPR
jgi:uncharacterized protein